MSKTQRIKSDGNLEVPVNDDEANVYIAEIIATRRSIDAIETDMQTEIDRVKADYETSIKALRTELNGSLKGLQAYFEVHRERLLKKNKSVHMPAGRAGWRMTPPKVSVKGAELVIARLRKLRGGAKRFLRTTVSVNKEALLDAPEIIERVEGLSTSQKEEFFVEPVAPRASEDTSK